MTISVALCTYNGAKYLPEQLASISAQKRLPNELVICDDGSTDATQSIVNDYANQAPFEVRVFINERNLGSTRNFSQAIQQCSGKTIALADQDDVWLPHKLCLLEKSLESAPQAGFAFSDAIIVDEELRPLGYSLWDTVAFRRREKRQVRARLHFDLLLRRYTVTGATMAFRSEYKDLILPIPPTWVHDAWIAQLISSVADSAFVDEPLIRYRQHPQQQIGGKKFNFFERFRIIRSQTQLDFQRQSDRFSEVLSRLNGRPNHRVAPEKIAGIEGKIAHCRSRARMRTPGTWRLPLVVKQAIAGHYRRYSFGWKGVVQDLLM